MLLYLSLGVVDFVLMRRYARVDPPQAPGPGAVATEQPRAVGYGAA